MADDRGGLARREVASTSAGLVEKLQTNWQVFICLVDQIVHSIALNMFKK